MIRSQNQIRIESNSSTMSDLVFLLLIFFMITSTLISPNAVKLLLPESNSKTMAKQNVTVYINDNFEFYVGDANTPASVETLEPMIEQGIQESVPGGETHDACVVLRSDKTVPVQYVVNVIDAVNAINERTGAQHKVILATQPE